MDKDINTKIKFSGRRLALLVMLILLGAVIFCGIIFWQQDEIVKIKNEQINSLNNQINTTLEKIHDLASE